MKCTKCGYDDHGSGDMAHVCASVNPLQPVIDESAAKRIATALGWEPKRKPLTDEEVIDIGTQCQWYDGDCERFDSIGFARAIEAAHGIKGENT